MRRPTTNYKPQTLLKSHLFLTTLSYFVQYFAKSNLQNIRISIPTQQHLVQFTRHLYGSPVHLMRSSYKKDSIPRIIFNEIICGPKINHSLPYQKQNFNNTLHISLPIFFKWNNRYYNSKKISPSGNSIININAHLHFIFTETLYSYYLSNKQVLGISFTKTIEMFKDQFQLTDEMISNDALKKIIQRRHARQAATIN